MSLFSESSDADGGKYCPYCDSDDLLPFESDEKPRDDHTIWVAILSALLVIGGYFLVLISSYMYFPIVLFGFIIFSAKMVNKRGEQKKREAVQEHDYLCADCGNS